MKWAAANDPASIFLLAMYVLIITSKEQVFNRIMLRQRNFTLGRQSLVVVSHLADVYHQGGDLKKTRFHFEAAARQETNLQDASLESWSHNLETWNEL
jgi:hypothetical protein